MTPECKTVVLKPSLTVVPVSVTVNPKICYFLHLKQCQPFDYCFRVFMIAELTLVSICLLIQINK